MVFRIGLGCAVAPGLTLLGVILSLLEFFVTATFIFAIVFFAPTALILALGFAICMTLIRHSVWILQKIWNLVCSMVEFVKEVPEEWRDIEAKIKWITILEKAVRFKLHDDFVWFAMYLCFIFGLIALLPLICYGGMLTWHVYGGHSTADNMHVVESIYKHHFGIFFDNDFHFPNIMNFDTDCIMDMECITDNLRAALWSIASLKDIIKVDQEQLLKGITALTTLNTFLALVRLVVPATNVILVFFGLSEGNVAVNNAIINISAGKDVDEKVEKEEDRQ